MHNVQKGQPRGRENISALQKAEKDTACLRENPDESLSRMGRVIGRIVAKLIDARREQQSTRQSGGEKRKFFYTSAEASAKDD